MRPTIPPSDVDVATPPTENAAVEASVLKIEHKIDELNTSVEEIHDYLNQTRNLIADLLVYVKKLGGIRK
jgi:hypothetical protein